MKMAIVRIGLAAAVAVGLSSWVGGNAFAQSLQSTSNTSTVDGGGADSSWFLYGGTYISKLSPGDTNYLEATGFGFTIPATVVIKGIEVDIDKGDDLGTGEVTDKSVKIMKAGVVTGAEHAQAGAWPGTLTDFTYGSPTDLWGQTWTPADINNAGFGVAIKANYSGVTSTVVGIDTIAITVYYAGCPPAAALGCVSGFAKGLLIANEKTVGKEKVLLKWINGPGSITPGSLGDPTVSGGPAYAGCIYNGGGALVAQLLVDRAGSTCGSKPCWKATAKGPKYADASRIEDGVLATILKGASAPTKPSLLVMKGDNKTAHLPLGIPAALLGDPHPIIQLFASGGGACYTHTLATLVQSAPNFYKAKTP